MFALGWSFSMPSQVTGLRGSCLVIPCRFEYSSTLPSPLRVLWYKYATGGYPVVYDQARPDNIIPEFRGKTNLYKIYQFQSMNRSPHNNMCSLKIYPLEMRHSGQQLYTWVDLNPISSYHRHNYQDKTVQLVVTGDQGRLYCLCSVKHTCPSHPPSLTWNVKDATTTTNHTQSSHGIWETSSTLKFVPTANNYEEELTCSAIFWRGKRQFNQPQPKEGPESNSARWLNVGNVSHSDAPSDFQGRPPRPEKRVSIWGRFSRQQPNDFPNRPPCPEKRRPQGYTANLNVGYRANNETLAGDIVSKPHYPSPKSNLKSATALKHMDDDAGNIYGNM
ncbi:hypothetical protein AAFF_G00233070 [Aldrovandia affinis]|uniref:Ig-like domain-containing protein n=1 Tax=Aldrovandia affinis TaxID=143900 RepID=A0AAD7REY7_9TELE|nr:hypothetical protein AAFF_G00233070 [Aldrovandia affinis]